MALPQKLSLDMLQTTWATALNPIIALPPVQGVFLKEVALKPGVNVVNHLLSRQLQGWILTDQDAAANIYRSAPANKLTLTLTSDNAVVVNLWVY